MKQYGVNELRKMFLEFFEKKGHLAMQSFSLVPQNDKSLLLINAGMAPLKPYFTGQEIPPNTRIATCQKCIRTGDIENVGKTARHGTFFEMLGNFSFGDYFKREAIAWTWEFLTETVGLSAKRLYPSVYLEDDEAFEIWEKEIGIPKEKIFRFGKEDNFWEHGAGPCGPCSEVYYDRGEEYGCDNPDCTVGCDCDRYVEVWNNVFTQFEGDGKGGYTQLAKKNIDTGMGLERLAMVVQGVGSIFDIDTVKALRDHVCQIAGVTYGEKEQTDVSVRVITDHVRAVTFMVSDGIMPSNEERGYVLRRLLRRACRHGRLLGIQEQFLGKLCETVIEGSKEGYPELSEKRSFLLQVVKQEEAQFHKTVDQGLRILREMEEQLRNNGKQVLSGEDAFRLHDTFGFPLDLTREILAERDIRVDEEGFWACMKIQQETARGAREETNYMGADATVYEQLDPALCSAFVGYERAQWDSEIMAMTTETAVAETLKAGERGTIFVKETPFYAVMGGQEADTGSITGEEGVFVVEDTRKVLGEKIAHIGYVKTGTFHIGQQVTLAIEEKQRALCARNHSATHLLQKALKIVLGSHVEQKGSSVNAQRLRFDFSHFAPMTEEEIREVERLVNEQIAFSLPVKAQEMPLEEAKKTGAEALFGEKYGAVVRVVSMGEFSVEFCGGTHVSNTNQIMAFRIFSETGVAAGVRRIEALTSQGLLQYYRDVEQKILAAAKLLKTTPELLPERIEHMLTENKECRQEVESLKSKLAREAVSDVTKQIEEVAGVKLLVTALDGVEMNGLRGLGDELKGKLGEGVVVIASKVEEKVNLMVTATDGAVEKGVHAGDLIKAIAPLVGGGGGGRPDMAQAGGKNPAGISEALQKAKSVLQKQLSGGA